MKKKLEHIEAMRGVAILLVLAFHLKVPFLSFGFLGVDIFFVISGFLMYFLYSKTDSRQLVKYFYLKRIRRILPAYLVTNLVFGIISFLVLLPHERIEIIKQLLANQLFLTNITNWLQEQYFATGSFRPFLNFWSLSVEMQFYLIFPLVAILLTRKKYYLAAFSFLISFAAYFFLDVRSPETAFFFTPTRYWQFIFGVLAALMVSKKPILTLKPIVTPTLGVLITAICVSAAFNSYLPTSIITLLITSLTAAYLYFGMYQHAISNPINRLLLLFGKYSYSLYLVHFPIIILLKHNSFDGNNLGEFSFKSTCLALLFTFITASLLYHFIETPFSVNRISNKTLVRSFSFLTAFFLFLNVPSVVLASSRVGFTKIDRNISLSALDRDTFRCGLANRAQFLRGVFNNLDHCLLTKNLGDPKYLLIGNSHADSIKSTVGDAIMQTGGTLYLAQENETIQADNIDDLKKLVTRLNVSTVILHSRSKTLELDLLKNFLSYLAVLKIRTILILPVPEFPYHVPSEVFKTHDAFSKRTNKDYMFENSQEIDNYFSLAKNFDLQIVSVVGQYCTPYCQVAEEGTLKPFYIDEGHLTLTGARVILQPLVQMIIATRNS